MADKITLWIVQGSFVLPGSRTLASFGPVRIADSSRQAASKYVAAMLRDQFRKELARANRQCAGRVHDFGDYFPMSNLQWATWAEWQKKNHPPAPAQEATVEMPEPMPMEEAPIVTNSEEVVQLLTT